MPRCQRTFRRLDSRRRNAAGNWVCPFCADHEIYESVLAPDLRSYLREALEACRHCFTVTDDGLRTDLYIGLYPECVWEPDEWRYEIYLQRGSDAHQMRLQIAHETFHRVCSQGKIYHWTHEMLACLFSVWFLQEAGIAQYGQQIDAEYRAEAQQLTLAGLLGTDLSKPPYPTGVYARAYVTGKTLEAITGRAGLCTLARTLDQTGTPDIRQWMTSLPAQEAFAVRQVMNMEL